MRVHDREPIGLALRRFKKLLERSGLVKELRKRPKLYDHYGATHESRYGDEITRLVQVLIVELARGQEGCSDAHAIARGMAGRFQTLHERLSLPTLILKAPVLPELAETKKK